MLARPLPASLTLFFSSILAIAGCGDDDGMATPDTGPGMVDAGVDAPMPPPDTAPPPSDNGTCAMPRVIEGMVGTVMVPGDTSDMREGNIDLGACGNDASIRFAPQDVIQYNVPGTGAMGITFTLINDGTPDNFDTVVQIRRDCTMIPPPEEFSCFDDAGDIRSAGGFQAMGGDTVFFIMTGYGETTVKGGTDRGEYVLEITARTNDAPTITMGDVRSIGERIEVEITGEDDDMDPFAFRASFLDMAGMPIAFDFDGDGPDDGNQIAQAWNPPIDPGTSPYTGRNRLEDLAPFATMAGATQVALELIDEVYAFSEPVTVPIRILNEVGIDEMCDAMNVCADPLICGMTTMVCEPTPEIAAACMAAMDITLATPTTTATTATVMGTFAAGDGLFTAPTDCSNSTPGTEHIFNVTVPAGMFDLIVSTDLPGSGTTDTVVYVQAACADPTDVTGCADDIDYPDNVASLVELPNIAEGDYAIFVDRWNGDMGPAFEMSVTLRPVLPSMSMCDPAGRMNRCMGMPCSAATMMCP